MAVTDPSFTAPSQDAGSALPFDALLYQNLINAIANTVMHRAPIPLSNITGVNTLTATATPTLPEWRSAQWFWFIAGAANTGPVSLSIDALPTKQIRNRSGLQLASGAWNTGDLVCCLYEGTYLRLIGNFGIAAAVASNGMAPGFISGFAMTTNAGDSANDIDVASGFARTESNAYDLIMPVGMTKRMDAVWSAGTGNGALLQSGNLAGTITIAANTSVAGSGTTFGTDYVVGDVIQTAGGQARRITAIASNTAMTVDTAWTSGESGVTYKRGGKARNCVYRVFAIGRDSDGTVDIAVSTRDTPVDLPAGWSGYARIDYQLTDNAGNNRTFIRSGDIRMLVSVVNQFVEAFGGATDYTSTRDTLLPPSVEAYYSITATAASTQSLKATVFPADLAAALGAPDFEKSDTKGFARGSVPLNANASFKTTLLPFATAIAYRLDLLGWRDTRGRGAGGIGVNSNAGRVSWPSSITPAALVADTHNWSPTGFAAATVVRIDYAVDGRQLTGLNAGAHGDIVELDNIGSATGILPGESVSSSAANRFAHTGRVYHWPGQSKRFRYDATAQRWRDVEGSGQGITEDEVTVASAATADIGAVWSERVIVTGGTVITSFGSKTNRKRWVRFQDWVMVTHNATTLALLGGGSRLYMPGDVSLFASDSSGNWRELAREAANGRVPHIVAQPDPFPTVPFKPRVWANWSVMHWLDDHFTFTRASVATYYDRAGILRYAAVGQPRFHTIYASGETGLYMEPARTNLFVRSEEFDNTWTYGGTSITANATAAPDGNTTADKLVEPATTGQHNITQSLGTLSIGAVYTLTVYAKAAERAQFWITGHGEGYSVFDLSLGTVIQAGGNVASIEALPNGWYRCRATITKTNTIGNMYFGIWNGGTTYTGVAGNGLYLWGAQAEFALFPSSYIPTTSAQVTRAADALFRSNADGVLNSAEATLFAKGVIPYGIDASTAYTAFAVSDNTINNFAVIRPRFTNTIQGVILTAGVAEMNVVPASFVAGSPFKAALAYKANDGALVVGGGAANTDSSINVPPVSRLEVGSFGAIPGQEFAGIVQQIAYLPRRVPVTNQQTMTA